jgi:hypothetical protein
MRRRRGRASASSPFAEEWPEWSPPLSHVAQGAGAWVREKLYARSGWGFGAILTPEVSRVRIDRIVQWVHDFAGGPEGLHILDLGAYEGAHSVALARLGAEVVAVEGREEHVRRARASKEQWNLDNLTIVHGDARRLIREQGRFDVVLCLGLLYHLDTDDLGPFVEAIGDTGCALAIVETQISLSSPHSFSYRGHEYRGRRYDEEIEEPGASLDNRVSFWLTRPSLVNLLSRAGFSSIAEAHVPNIAVLTAFRDHVALIAKRSG